MIIYNRGIQTKRAFIAFDNIQHISWKNVNSDDVECKIHSASSHPIIQTMNSDRFDAFLKSYQEYMGCA